MPTEMDVKHAVARAMEYFNDLVPNVQGLTLEEVERMGQLWLITLGYFESPLGLIGGGPKTYKAIKVDAETGEVLSMKIRKP